MELFLNQVFSAPTLYFALPFVFLILFWVLTIAGFADFEFLDSFLGTNTGLDSGTENDSNSPQSSWLESLGLDGVPLTVVVTIIDFYALVITYFARKYLMPLFDDLLSATALGLLVAVFAVVIALPISAMSIKPLRRFFYTHEAIGKNELIGTLCTVTTQSVTESFGQASSDQGMVFSVRAAEPNKIIKGSRVALIEFKPEQDYYTVVTEAELMAMSSDYVQPV